MALLNFPANPDNGDVYPQNPVPGQVQYQWDAANITWRLIGSATGVVGGTYGDAYNVGQFTVDTAGRIVFAQNVPIVGGGGSVGDLQLVTNNGATTSNAITVGGLTSAGLTYPTSDGTAGQVLTTNGSGALSWTLVGSTNAITPNYASYLSTVDQTAALVNTGQPVTLDTTTESNNFTLVNNSEITATVAGIYNLQFSLQLISAGGGGHIVEVWLVKEGTAVPDSNTRFHLKNANEEVCASLNYVFSLGAGEDVQLYWATDNISVKLAALPSVTDGPDVPSAIVTIVPVGV